MGGRRLCSLFISCAVVVALLAISAGTGWAGALDQADSTVDTTAEAVPSTDDGADAIGDTTEAISDTSSDTTDSVTADDTTTERVTNEVSDTTEETTTTLDDATEQVSPEASELPRIVRRAASAVMGSARDRVGSSGADGEGGTAAGSEPQTAAAISVYGSAASGKLEALRTLAAGQQGDDDDDDDEKLGDLPLIVGTGNLLTGDSLTARVLSSRLDRDRKDASGDLAFTGAGLSRLLAVAMTLLSAGACLIAAIKRRPLQRGALTV